MLRNALIGICVLLAAGCVHHHQSIHPHGMPPGQAKKFGHLHGEGCGHVFVDGVWVTVSLNASSGKHKGKGH